MSATLFTKLPNEILLILLDFLTEAGLNALTQTCRRFHHSLEHSLYVRNARERNSSALQWAALYGVVDTVRKALAAGADPNSRREAHNPDPDNFLDDIYRSAPLKGIKPHNSCIAAAAMIGSLDIVSLLMKAGAYAGGGPGGSPLVAAVAHNQLESIKLLITSKDIDIDSDLYLRHDCNLLSIAVHRADVRVVCYLLALMKQPDAFTSRFSTPLIVAIERMRFELIPILLRSPKIDPNKVDRNGRTPFMWAVKGAVADSSAVELLLNDERVDVNAVDREGRTAIFSAAQDGNERMVRLLLATPKVDPNLADDAGIQPVARALQQGHKSVAEIFMASDRVKARMGTLFHYACQHAFTGMVKTLLKFNRAEQSTVEADGGTWLHSAAIFGRADAANVLLRHGHVDINSQRLDGATPLICATQMQRTSTITALLQAGADVNIPTTDGHSALFYASESKYEALTVELLKRGAKVGAVTDTGETALYHACATGRTKIAQVLLGHGADPLLRANNGRTPLHVACANRWKQTVEALLRVVPPSHSILSAGWTPLHDACQAGQAAIAKRLIELGADPLARHQTGATPLEYACNGHPLIVKMLLEKGANPQQMTTTGVSLLCHAARRNHPMVATLLLEHGADPNAVEIGGTTAFLEAARQKGGGSVLTLLKHGGDVTSVRQNGATALHGVCDAEYGYSGHEAIKALIEKGADINAQSIQGFTPLHVACMRERKEYIQQLIAYGADPLAEVGYAWMTRRRTALHVASHFPSSTENLEYLFDWAKFSVPIAGLWQSGWTPLHEAASVLNPGAVKILLKRGVNPMAIAENGQMALHQVFVDTQLHQPEFQKRAAEVIVALMETGKVDINYRDNKGKTTLRLAGTALGSLRTLLIKWGAKE